jgi:hypothetical protein
MYETHIPEDALIDVHHFQAAFFKGTVPEGAGVEGRFTEITISKFATDEFTTFQSLLGIIQIIECLAFVRLPAGQVHVSP